MVAGSGGSLHVYISEHRPRPARPSAPPPAVPRGLGVSPSPTAAPAFSEEKRKQTCFSSCRPGGASLGRVSVATHEAELPASSLATSASHAAGRLLSGRGGVLAGVIDRPQAVCMDRPPGSGAASAGGPCECERALPPPALSQAVPGRLLWNLTNQGGALLNPGRRRGGALGACGGRPVPTGRVIPSVPSSGCREAMSLPGHLTCGPAGSRRPGCLTPLCPASPSLLIALAAPPPPVFSCEGRIPMGTRDAPAQPVEGRPPVPLRGRHPARWGGWGPSGTEHLVPSAQHPPPSGGHPLGSPAQAKTKRNPPEPSVTSELRVPKRPQGQAHLSLWVI